MSRIADSRVTVIAVSHNLRRFGDTAMVKLKSLDGDLKCIENLLWDGKVDLVVSGWLVLAQHNELEQCDTRVIKVLGYDGQDYVSYDEGLIDSIPRLWGEAFNDREATHKPVALRLTLIDRWPYIHALAFWLYDTACLSRCGSMLII